MASIRVFDINEEDKPEPIEEIKEEVIEEAKPEVVNEVVEEVKQEKYETVEEVCKEIKQPEKTQDKMITCPKCNKSMKLRSYRYKHEKPCAGTLETKTCQTIFKANSKTKGTTKDRESS